MLKKLILLILVLFFSVTGYFYLRAMNDIRTADVIWEILYSSPDFRERAGESLNLSHPLIMKYYNASVSKDAGYAHAAEITMTGGFKLGDNWLDLKAEQVLFPEKGFVWKASIGSGLTFIKGFDFYYNKRGVVNFKVWGLIPVVKLEGEDIARASIGRLLAESILVPSAFFSEYGSLMTAIDKDTIKVAVELDGEKTEMMIKISSEGLPSEVVIQRWGDVNPEHKFMYTPFGMKFTRYEKIDGYTIPVEMSGGWNYGTERYMETVKLEFEKVKFF